MDKAKGHIACGVAVIGLLLASTACGPAVRTAEQKHDDLLRGIQASYDNYFQISPPAYVVITYPESSSALTKHGQEVFEIVKNALASKEIPYECSKLDDVLTTVTDRRKKEYLTFRVPEPMTTRLAGSSLLYINLCMDRDLKTKKHPVAAEHDISVRIWNDEYTKDEIKKATM